MKALLLIAATLILGSTAMAETKPITCIKGDGDSIKVLNIYPSGEIVMTFYEAHLYYKKEDIQKTISADTQQSRTEIYSAQNVKTHLAVEGEESEVISSLVFVYNPDQKAGRLTVVSDGYTNLRNELFTGCNNNPIQE